MAKKQIKKGFITALSMVGIGIVSIATVSYISFSQINNISFKKVYFFYSKNYNYF